MKSKFMYGLLLLLVIQAATSCDLFTGKDHVDNRNQAGKLKDHPGWAFVGPQYVLESKVVNGARVMTERYKDPNLNVDVNRVVNLYDFKKSITAYNFTGSGVPEPSVSPVTGVAEPSAEPVNSEAPIVCECGNGCADPNDNGWGCISCRKEGNLCLGSWSSASRAPSNPPPTATPSNSDSPSPKAKKCCICQWGDAGCSGTDSASCTASGSDCRWQSGSCVDRHQGECQDWLNAQTGCDYSWSGPTSTNPPADKMAECTEISHDVDRHGDGPSQVCERVDNLLDIAPACTSICTIDEGCSNAGSIQDIANCFMNLCNSNSGVDITVETNQMVSGDGCQVGVVSMTCGPSTSGAPSLDVAPCSANGGSCWKNDNGNTLACEDSSGTTVTAACCCDSSLNNCKLQPGKTSCPAASASPSSSATP